MVPPNVTNPVTHHEFSSAASPFVETRWNARELAPNEFAFVTEQIKQNELRMHVYVR